MYRVVTDAQVQRQLDALPAPALAAFAELRVLLEVDPWAGGPVRRVDLLQIAWLG